MESLVFLGTSTYSKRPAGDEKDSQATSPGSIAAAEEGDAIGGYLPGLTIRQLDETWPNEAVRDARPCGTCSRKWPLVIFSHGSGAFRASYIYWTEFLASHGFVVMAC